MNKPIADLVFPVISRALDLRDRLERGETVDLETEQRALLDMLGSDGETRWLTDYVGDGVVFLGVRYALACWLDELFILHSPWGGVWNEKKMEVTLFGSLDRATKFWDQVDLVLKRPNTPRPSVTPGPDAVEVYFLCITLGFRGRYLLDPAKVQEYVAAMRPLVSKTGAWEPPRDLGVTTNAEPLTGRDDLRRVAWVYGGLTLALLVTLLVLTRFTLASRLSL